MIIYGLCYGGGQKRKGSVAVGFPSDPLKNISVNPRINMRKERKTKCGVRKKLLIKLPRKRKRNAKPVI